MAITGLFGRLIKRIEDAKDAVIARINASFAEIQQTIDANMLSFEIDNFSGLEKKPALTVEHVPIGKESVDPSRLSWSELRTTAIGMGIKTHAVKRPLLEQRVTKAMSNGSVK